MPLQKDVLRPVDEQSRRHAKTLIRTERYTALGTLEADGFPAVSRINIATTFTGEIFFLASALSGHFMNLASDCRCSVLLGEPGKGDPLAHPRLTLLGEAARIKEPAERRMLRQRYLMRHPKSELYVDFPDFCFFKIRPSRATFNAGFGKAYAMTASDLACPILDELATIEAGAIQHMNADHADAIDRLAERVGAQGKGWRLSCIDPEGLDLIRGDDTARVWFDTPLTSAGALRPTLVALCKA